MTSWNPNEPDDGSAQPQQPPPPYGHQPYPPAPPPYGQQPYPPAPPPYGQPPYGQPPYGQPPYGQQPYAGYAGGPMPPPGTQYGWQPMAPVPGGRLASMAARLGGLVIDVIVVGIPTGLIGLAFGAYDTTETCDAAGNCTRGYHYGTSWAIDLIGLAIGVIYSAWLVGLTGRTLGHRAVGIKVVDAESGGLIGAGRGALRWLVMILGGALCTIGYWSPFFDSRRRQGWHDKAARSVVIPVSRGPT